MSRRSGLFSAVCPACRGRFDRRLAVCPHCGLPITGTADGLRGRAALRRQRQAMERCRQRGHLPGADCVCLRCGASVHDFDGCTCRRCGLRRDDGHRWKGCHCAVCGKTSPPAFHPWDGCVCPSCGLTRARGHDFDGCTCRKCGLRRDEGHRWEGCRCAVCGAVSPQPYHVFDGCACVRCGAPLLEDAAHDWVYEGFGDCDESCGLRAPANDREVYLPPREVCVYHGGSCPHLRRYRCSRCGAVKVEQHF